jgi:purine-binding chemotaxis protein CheW
MTHMGALADSVKEVIALEPGQISPPPKLGVKIENEFIKGMGKQDDKFLMILDIDKVLTADELEIVQKSSEARETTLKKKELETNSPPPVMPGAEQTAAQAASAP